MLFCHSTLNYIPQNNKFCSIMIDLSEEASVTIGLHADLFILKGHKNTPPWFVQNGTHAHSQIASGVTATGELSLVKRQ